MKPHLRSLHAAAAFLVLLGLGANEHFAARGWIETATLRNIPISGAGTTARIALTELVQAHPGIVLGYAASVTALLIWLGASTASRVFVWATFAVITSPCVIYLWACLRIGNKLSEWSAGGG